MKEARYKSPRVVGLRFYEIPRTGKSVESESDFVTRVCRVTTNRDGVSWGRGAGGENMLEFRHSSGDIIQPYECTKNHCILHSGEFDGV